MTSTDRKDPAPAAASFVIRHSFVLRHSSFVILFLTLLLFCLPTAAGSPEREDAALAIVRQHQPELARLLDYLRKNQPRQYQRAVRELARTADRLSQIKERDPQRYELELQAWKARSRIDLLAAKLQLKPTDELRERLRTAIVEHMAAQKELLTRERARLTQRLQNLDAQLQTLESGQPAEIERRMRSLTEGRRKNVTTPLDTREPPAAKDER